MLSPKSPAKWSGLLPSYLPACPSARGVLSRNSKEVKAALYRDTVVFTSLREKEVHAC